MSGSTISLCLFGCPLLYALKFLLEMANLEILRDEGRFALSFLEHPIDQSPPFSPVPIHTPDLATKKVFRFFWLRFLFLAFFFGVHPSSLTQAVD